MSATKQTDGGELILYESPDGDVRLDVRLEHDSIWLTQRQMAELFGTSTDNVGLHLKNVFVEGELSEEATTEDSSVVRVEGGREVRRSIRHYNLDAIISVGYRVNSARGTQFRIWATGTLRDHLLRGYTMHERRLHERGLAEMQQAVALMARTLTRHSLVTDDGAAVLDVVRRYSRSWKLLLEYDEQRLPAAPKKPQAESANLTLQAARRLVADLRTSLSGRGQAGDLFGWERDGQLDAILGGIEQTFDGRPLYASAQERAAHLLYFVIKDHPFADGNKRIASLLFLDYLARNGLLARGDGTQRVEDTTMVALALLVAESEPSQKELMIRLIVGLLDDAADV